MDLKDSGADAEHDEERPEQSATCRRARVEDRSNADHRGILTEQCKAPLPEDLAAFMFIPFQVSLFVLPARFSLGSAVFNAVVSVALREALHRET